MGYLFYGFTLVYNSLIFQSSVANDAGCEGEDELRVVCKDFICQPLPPLNCLFYGLSLVEFGFSSWRC
jgi:hypothetical protein